jgi:hypothetical protein
MTLLTCRLLLTLSRWDEKRYDVDSVWQRSIRRFVHFIKSSKNFVKSMYLSLQNMVMLAVQNRAPQNFTSIYESHNQKAQGWSVRKPKKIICWRFCIVLKPGNVYSGEKKGLSNLMVSSLYCFRSGLLFSSDSCRLAVLGM